jgi:hypothetical protein
MKKLLKVEDIKIEKDDNGLFARTPEGDILREDDEEKLKRLIEEYVEEYNKKVEEYNKKLVSTRNYGNSGPSR